LVSFCFCEEVKFVETRDSARRSVDRSAQGGKQPALLRMGESSMEESPSVLGNSREGKVLLSERLKKKEEEKERKKGDGLRL
jgi:hypothetical protein